MMNADGTQLSVNLSCDQVKTFLAATFKRTQKSLIAVCYSGHGEVDTGDWEVAGKPKWFRLIDLLQLWFASAAYAHGSHLFLLIDACYSGCWVQRTATPQVCDDFKDLSHQLQDHRVTIQVRGTIFHALLLTYASPVPCSTGFRRRKSR